LVDGVMRTYIRTKINRTTRTLPENRPISESLQDYWLPGRDQLRTQTDDLCQEDTRKINQSTALEDTANGLGADRE
jgi:hypothetical protein